MSKRPGRLKKVTDDIPYNARALNYTVTVQLLKDFNPLPEEEEHTTSDQIV